MPKLTERQNSCLRPTNEPTPSLELRVHGVDGSVATFTQHEQTLVRDTLAGFQPARMFTQRRITIGGERSLTTFIADRVTRIDLITEHLPNWKLPSGSVDAVELAEAAFRSLIQNSPQSEGARLPSSPEESGMAMIEIALLGGQRLYLARELVGGMPSTSDEAIDSLFASSSLSFLTRTGGVAVLNVANVVRFTTYPPARATEDAWPAYSGGDWNREHRREMLHEPHV